METVFKELLRINLSHNFYSDEIIPEFSITPTDECKRTLRNYGLLFRQSANGFNLLSQTTGRNSSTPLKQLSNAGKFSFILTVRDSYFLNFSDLPLDVTSKQFYHFSNITDNVQNSKPLLTADSSAPYSSGDDLIFLKPNRFKYTETNPNPTATVQITDAINSSVILETVNISGGELNYDIDLSGYANGRYKLYVNGVLKLDFYADDSIYKIKPFAVIDLYINDSLSSSYSPLDSNGDISSKSCFIKFNKRKTLWKYFIVLKNRTSIDPNDLTIEYPGNTNSFNKGSIITLSDGDTAVPFTSQNEIEFNEEVIKGIQLKKTNGSSTGWFDIENLPNASVKNIKPDLTNNKVYSEIYVYI